MDISRDQAAAELNEVAARLRLDNRDLLRVVARARKAGMRQRAIEQHLDISQTTVHRLLRQSAETPEALEPTPAEIVDRRTAGQISCRVRTRCTVQHRLPAQHHPAQIPPRSAGAYSAKPSSTATSIRLPRRRGKAARH